MTWLEGLEGVLLDVDGTLLEDDAPVPGAVERLDELRRAGLACGLITNTTRRPRRRVAEALQRAGFAVGAEDVLAPAVLARRRILDSGRRRVFPIVPQETAEDLDGIESVEDSPDWVVVGDVGDAFRWELLNRAFRFLLDGARLLALHRNRYWHAGARGLLLDAGPFVAALEYASGQEAEVVGKPSPAFYRLALAELGLEPSRVLVVGDDVINEGIGAAAVGCRTALVRTGKFRADDLQREGFRPDLLLDSVAELRS